MSGLDRELGRARAVTDRAMREARENREDEGLAGVRAAFAYGRPDLKRNLPRFEETLGVEVDAGAFLLGMVAAAFAIQDIDILKIAGVPGARHVIVRQMELARQEVRS